MRKLSEKQVNFLVKHCGLTVNEALNIPYQEASKLISNKTDEWSHGATYYGDDPEIDYDYDNIDPMDDWVAGMGHGDR